MVRKEIQEMRALYAPQDCGILRICGCYVDGEKNKISQFNETFLNLPEEERFKYLEIFKKTLSGTPGKNLIDMRFSLDAYANDGARTFLHKLRDSELKEEKLLDTFYDKMIAAYNYPGNYLVLLIYQVYDVPGVGSDHVTMEDASDTVFRYVLCSVCPVKLSKPGLGYDKSDNAFHNMEQFHMVDAPETGFLFPAFNDRREDEDNVWYYSKDADNFAQGLLGTVLNCEMPLPAADQKEAFQTLIAETLGEECDYDTLKNIHDNLNEWIAESKSSPQPAALNKTEVKELLEKSGVNEERLTDFEAHFEQAAGENATLLAVNIAQTKKFEVKTPDVVIKVNPDRTDLIETMVIEGRKCLVIQIDEHLEVNGISVNPHTGEVTVRDGEQYGEL